jgi:PAS domain S-box-containing protein
MPFFRELTLRATQTITPVEQIFPAQQRLISATDSSDKITYCNDEFTKISGYSRQELVGSPHNLVRHPDMPSAVFGMMWSYLKAGKSWMGVAGTVNRTAKNANAAVARGSELETTSRGLRALVERFNR